MTSSKGIVDVQVRPVINQTAKYINTDFGQLKQNYCLAIIKSLIAIPKTNVSNFYCYAYGSGSRYHSLHEQIWWSVFLYAGVFEQRFWIRLSNET